MKKIIALLLALSLCAVCCAETAGTTGIANPMQEVETLDDVCEACGCLMYHPPVMGVTDESYYIYELEDYTLGEYNFTVAGINYTLRAAPTVDEDISGVWINGETAFGAIESGISYASDDGIVLARWANVEGQYVLMAKGETLPDAETFAAVAQEMADLTNPAMSESELASEYAALAGSYTDTVSQRATMDVTDNGDSVSILVHWSDSWNTYTSWEMTARIGEDGLLYYTDCKKSNVTDDTAAVEYENGEGFFSIGEDGSIAWNGAADADCADCVFARDGE